MPRSRTRARNRRARLESVRAQFEQHRQDPEALAMFLREHAESTFRLWDIARPAPGAKPLDDDELAIIGQTVAPHLVRMKPGLVRDRDEILNRIVSVATAGKQ